MVRFSCRTCSSAIVTEPGANSERIAAAVLIVLIRRQIRPPSRVEIVFPAGNDLPSPIFGAKLEQVSSIAVCTGFSLCSKSLLYCFRGALFSSFDGLNIKDPQQMVSPLPRGHGIPARQCLRLT